MVTPSPLSSDLQALLRARPNGRPDAAEIENGVRKYCRALRANASDTVAAINAALRAGGDTLSAVRVGRQRAAQLHDRRIHSLPPTKA
jgi:hypothetical protein